MPNNRKIAKSCFGSCGLLLTTWKQFFYWRVILNKSKKKIVWLSCNALSYKLSRYTK